jgi:putative membrane protein
MMRRTLLILGIVALAGAWFSPLPWLAQGAFFAHMARHMLVVALAAPLLALGIAGSSLDPVRKWPALFPPIPISLLELLVVWAWHTPALHHAARQSLSGFAIEQGSFLLCGFLIWLSVFGGKPADREERAGAGVAALLLTSMHMTLLGALLALAPRALYQHATHFPGLTQLEDQHLGGAVMLIVGGVSYLAGGLWLTACLIRQGSKAREMVT